MCYFFGECATTNIPVYSRLSFFKKLSIAVIYIIVSKISRHQWLRSSLVESWTVDRKDGRSNSTDDHKFFFQLKTSLRILDMSSIGGNVKNAKTVNEK